MLHPLTAILLAVLPPVQEPAGQDPPPASLTEALLQQMEDGHQLEYGDQRSLVSFHGFLELDYHDEDGAPSTFDLHHANLLLDVTVATDLDGRFEFEWEHGAAKVEMDQVYLRYHPWADDRPTFVLGRFYAPFGIERQIWYPPLSRTITRPLATQEVVPNSWYESGAMIDWRLPAGPGSLHAEAAVSNGLGPVLDTNLRAARQERDTNQDKMLSGRLGYDHASGWSAGASFASGRYDLAGDQSFSFLGADLAGDLGPVELSAEWILSEVDAPASPGRSLRRQGGYVLAYLPVYQGAASELGTFVRADAVDPDDDRHDAADRNSYSLGLRWVPTSHLTLKLEAQFVDQDLPGPHRLGDSIWLQAVLDF